MPSPLFPLKRLFLLLCLLALALVMIGCKTNRPTKWWEFWLVEEDTSENPVYPGPDIVLPPPPEVLAPDDVGDADSLAAQTAPVDTETGTLREMRPAEETTTADVVSELKTVFFDYDSYELSPNTIAALENNAQWLKMHPDLTVRIEGHCDERGSIEYNFNLGQKRASAVREYLARMGVDPARMNTISYGEERPLDPRSSEDAWAKNRRAQFFVY